MSYEKDGSVRKTYDQILALIEAAGFYVYRPISESLSRERHYVNEVLKRSFCLKGNVNYFLIPKDEQIAGVSYGARRDEVAALELGGDCFSEGPVKVCKFLLNKEQIIIGIDERPIQYKDLNTNDIIKALEQTIRSASASRKTA